MGGALSKAKRMHRKRALSPIGPLRGTARIPGDKSISHRALMLAALAVGDSRIEGLNEGSDVLATAAALRAMGAGVERGGDGDWRVDGVGVGGLLQPETVLDLGNSGTSARLLAGLVASHPIRAILTGDASLRRRPMDRVAAPLRRLGARIDGDRLPLTIEGVYPAIPCAHSIEVPSAQVKSALLLAGLNTPGITEVIEPAPTRDHSERLLRAFGAEIDQDGSAIRLRGEVELSPQSLTVPGDASAAAFLAVAAAIVPGSELRIEAVGVNPRRTGLFRALEAMGADLSFGDARDIGGEPVADLIVNHSPLTAIDVPPELVPDMIDEFPIFLVAAAIAKGRSRACGLGELRLKESDRIATMAAGLRAIGVRVEDLDDGLVIHGGGGAPLPGGGTVETAGDHRVAMAFAVAGLHAAEPIGIDDMGPIASSFPDFEAALRGLAGI